jgi:hypothetical protein
MRAKRRKRSASGSEPAAAEAPELPERWSAGRKTECRCGCSAARRWTLSPARARCRRTSWRRGGAFSSTRTRAVLRITGERNRASAIGIWKEIEYLDGGLTRTVVGVVGNDSTDLDRAKAVKTRRAIEPETAINAFVRLARPGRSSQSPATDSDRRELGDHHRGRRSTHARATASRMASSSIPCTRYRSTTSADCPK